MGKVLAGAGLLLAALLMFTGFLRSGANLAPATIFALLLTVGAPAAGGVWLITTNFRRDKKLVGRRDELRQRTLEAEVLRLAGARGGKLTVVEMVSELAVSPEEAKATLEALAIRGLAEVEVTESGVLVFAFHDIQHLGEKSRSKGVLGD
jgi:hypothetical protein